MKRRSYLSAAAGAVAGVALLQPASASAAVGAQEFRRGEADVDLSVHSVEEEEHVQYFEDPAAATEGVDVPVEEDYDEALATEGVVRFAAALSGEEVVLYATSAWENFAEMRCRYAAAREAAAHVESELDRDIGSGSSSRAEEGTSHAVVSVRTEEDDDLSLEDVAAVTPRSVQASYELDGKVYETEVPIYAQLMPTVDENLDDADFTAGSNPTQDADGNISSEAGPDSGEDGDTTQRSDDDPGGDEDEGESDDSGPGFGVAGALAGLGGLSALARKRLGTSAD